MNSVLCVISLCGCFGSDAGRQTDLNALSSSSSMCSVDDSDVIDVVLADTHSKRGRGPLMWFDKFCVSRRI